MKQQDDSQLISYLTLRKLIGILGIALPFMVWFGHSWFRGMHLDDKETPYRLYSISASHQWYMRDLFVCVICILAAFLFTYKGDQETIDGAWANMAGAFAVLVAFCPTYAPGLIHYFHYIGAVGLFLVFAVFCLWIFPKQLRAAKDSAARKRTTRIIYISCGVTIVVGMILCLVLADEDEDRLSKLYPESKIFWLEAMMLVAFGFSWLVRGHLLRSVSKTLEKVKSMVGK